LRVVIDGIIFALQATGGISRVFSEVLPRICSLDAGVAIDLLMTLPRKQVLPQHEQIRIRQGPLREMALKPESVWRYPMSAFNGWWLQRNTSESTGAIWHSTYFTSPRHWPGPKVVTVHDMIYELYPQMFSSRAENGVREQKRHCVTDADAVICVSENTRQDVLEIYGLHTDKVHVAPNGFSPVFKRLPDLTPLPSGMAGPFLLYVGARSHYKNFNGLLEAFSRWRERDSVSLVVVGQAWSGSEEQKIRELGISGRVLLQQNIGDIALRNLYNRALALVYPSLYEGFGIPLLEAMACGCPVICANTSSIPEVVGDAGIYFDPQNTEEIIDVMDYLIKHSDTVTELCKRGLNRVSQFSWERTASATYRVYRSLL